MRGFTPHSRSHVARVLCFARVGPTKRGECEGGGWRGVCGRGGCELCYTPDTDTVQRLVAEVDRCSGVAKSFRPCRRAASVVIGERYILISSTHEVSSRVVVAQTLSCVVISCISCTRKLVG